jgi:hypothetical protein
MTKTVIVNVDPNLSHLKQNITMYNGWRISTTHFVQGGGGAIYAMKIYQVESLAKFMTLVINHSSIHRPNYTKL